ncbi:MAG: zinc ABC transporter substrate-binding protein [Ruminococcus sp.]|nr:zinc ABC transporter substrate-binding protein [Candidatus Copronaster equi]
MKSRIAAIILAICLTLSVLCGCTPQSINEDDKLQILCSIFAPYDFARQVAGDRAEVKMLLPPGVESHSFEPSPADIISLDNADLFFYVSENTETWVCGMLDSVSPKQAIDISEALGIEVHEHDHEHEHEHEHEEHEHEEDEKDEHIWTDMNTAIQMVDLIADKLSQADEKNSSYYNENAKKYINEIKNLRDDFSLMINNSARKEIVSGSRFAMKNFTNEFGLKFTAAFDSCVDNTEPSAAVMANIIDTIKKDKIPVVFYEELTEPKISRAVSVETGAKMLLLHSCHNVSVSEMKSGVTYLSLMKQNYTNIKEALN